MRSRYPTRLGVFYGISVIFLAKDLVFYDKTKHI